MVSRRSLLLTIISVLFAASGCHAPRHYRPEPPATPPGVLSRNVVVWISIDGFRHDYVDRNVTPFLRKLMREGAYSQKLVPITPSLTFPSHATEATGVPASAHGITANDFYDAATAQSYKMSSDASLLSAEPIWFTAQRQNVRTLVYDWVFSYRSASARIRNDYALDKFDAAPTDEQRLTRILDTWRSDAGDDKPLRLLMGYIKEPDHIGHRSGPESPAINDAVHATDAILETFINGVVEQFNRQRVGDEQLYVLLSTDHGMTPVKTLINGKLLFASVPPESRVITSGPLAYIYLDKIPADQRDATRKRVLADIRKHDGFLSAYTHESLPKSWRLDHPTRVGDITVMLDPGCSFSTKFEGELAHVVQAGDEPQGMHGFPPDKCADMRGLCVIWRYPTSIGGRNVGTVHTEQLHPTVAKLLGIHPAEDAKAAAVIER
jgi:alkaline phosphatase D